MAFEMRVVTAKGDGTESVNSGVLHLGGEVTVVRVWTDAFDNAHIDVEGNDCPHVTVNGAPMMLTDITKENR